MTVAAELLKSAQRIEHFVTIEGVGWPTNDLYGALSGGFSGVVFATNDLDGDLATKLGCTVYKGLKPPEGISESIDPRLVTYSPSGLTLDIQDNNNWWVNNCTPRKVGNTTALTSAITFWGRTLRLDNGTSFAEGDQVWVGGHELVVLGAKAAVSGTVYDYTNCTRGYLGTRKGSAQRRPEDYCMNHWPVGTSVQSTVWWWWNRRVALWAHVPGEAVANCQCVWFGKLRKTTNKEAGNEWQLSCVGDVVSDMSRVYRAVDWRVWSNRLAGSGELRLPSGTIRSTDAKAASYGLKRLLEFGMPSTARFGADGTGLYELANAYQWRTEPGGVDSMVSDWDSGSVLAADVDSEADILYSYVLVNESAYLMLHKETYDSNSYPNKIVAEIASATGNSRVAQIIAAEDNVGNSDMSFGPDSKARFLLDNYQTSKQKGRFVVNGVYSDHPIDVALMFLLSTDRHYARQLAGAGTTASRIYGAFGLADDANGYALFCMAGTYKHEARTISDTTTTYIDVERAFTGASAVGVEFQVRNSIYDVLPLGWGMGVDAQGVDVESFEAIRDGALANATLGKFMLGVQDEIDIWELINKQIFQPYGVLVYFDYTTRKLTARYIGPTAPDGVFEDYTAIDRKHIYKFGSIVHNFRNPIGTINLKVRSEEQRVVGFTATTGGRTGGNVYDIIQAQRDSVPEFLGGNTTTLRLKSAEASIAFAESELDQIEIEALLNTESDCGGLAARLLGQIGEYSVPPPVWGNAEVDVELYDSCKPGSYVILNWHTPDAPANPLTGGRGWVDVIGRILERGYPRRGALHFKLTVELLSVNLIGRVAPVAIVTAKGSDGVGAYFDLSTTDLYVADPDTDSPQDYFEVGDVVQHLDKTGKRKASWSDRTITVINGPKIYLNGAIGSTVAAGDFITFASWNSATVRMQKYSAYAGTAGVLDEDGGNEAQPRRYG